MSSTNCLLILEGFGTTEISSRITSAVSSRRPILLILPFALALAAYSATQTATPHSSVGVQSGSSTLPPDARRLIASPPDAGRPNLWAPPLETGKSSGSN
jgi:hypothetical protein